MCKTAEPVCGILLSIAAQSLLWYQQVESRHTTMPEVLLRPLLGASEPLQTRRYSTVSVDGGLRSEAYLVGSATGLKRYHI